ncbi:NADH:ubiquinone oxidoreductase complex I intermediate-associated protein 30, partial [Violaceomyces palustris]
RPWRTSDFKSIDDRVRGGSSQSYTSLYQSSDHPDRNGELIFSGFLDTTTLGGAGFASQSTSDAFPIKLEKKVYRGLRLVVRNPDPGGGKNPVTSFVLELKTVKPATRPDGRRESTIVWEWKFDLPRSSAQRRHLEDLLVYESTWNDFKPKYRGRPVEDPDVAGEFRPQDTLEWSFMARSNF